MDTNQALQRINELKALKARLRAHERNLVARYKTLGEVPALGSGYGDIQQVESNFRKFLPESHVPGNIGGLNRVAWKFYYQVNFDFGDDAVVNDKTSLSQEFQVSQEAAFILMGVSRDCGSQVTEFAPWSIEFKDRQSSRVLMDRPIPYQMLGTRSKFLVLTTPFLIMPNAKFETAMRGTTSYDLTLTGENKHQITFFGYRVRIEDADKVLSSVFGRR